MTYDFPVYVCREMMRRAIPLAIVRSVLDAPEYEVPERGNVVCYQSRAEIDRKLYLLRVMANERAMKITYDPEVDVLRILLRDAAVEESGEDKAGVILDYDKEGNVVGMEVLNASQRVESPRAVDYAVTG